MKILLYSVIALLGVLAIIGWQQANSLRYQVAVRDATIDNLMVSQAQDKIPELVYLVEEKPVESVKVVYLDRPVDRPTEKLVYKELTDFQGLAEFQQLVDRIGIVIPWDGGCYDAALFYWRQAYEQGKRVFLDSVEPAEYNRYFTKRIQRADEGHIVVSVVVGRQLYWLDPSTAEIILRGELLK